jgi:carbon monoxide dehydrogenase subunit G
MKFENRTRVHARPEAVWTFLMDIPRMAACVPGVEEVVAEDEDNFRGVMRVRLGPISLRFGGHVSIVERDVDKLRATMRAEGADRGAGGAVKATVEMALQPADEETELVVSTTADVLGRLGQFGQPVMRAKADAIMREFAATVSEQVNADPAPTS